MVVTRVLQNVETFLSSLKLFFLLCFHQNLSKIGMFYICVKPYLDKSSYVSFLNKLPVLCTNKMDIVFTYKAKREINLQPVIQIRPAVNSSLCREFLWPFIFKVDSCSRNMC